MNVAVYKSGMEGRQIKAARALLGLSQEELCKLSGITRPTLNSLETDSGDPKRSSLAAVEDALRKKGITFTDDGKIIGVLVPKGGRK